MSLVRLFNRGQHFLHFASVCQREQTVLNSQILLALNRPIHPLKGIHSMAYHCSSKTNDGLVENMSNKILKRYGGTLTSDDEIKRVADAFRKVDRKNYVPNPQNAYEDSPQLIGHNATISAPHMHAYAVEYLFQFLNPGSRVLDVGSGSGYTCAVFHHLVNSEDDRPGLVVGIDHIDALVQSSISNLKKDGLEKALRDKQIMMITGDGRKGDPEERLFDAIHVGAAAPGIPEALIHQLASPGRMFIPVGGDGEAQQIILVDKDENEEITQTPLLGVMYVPLTDPDTQLSGRRKI